MPDPFRHAAEVLRQRHVHQALQVLDAEEQRIIALRFGLDGGDARTLSDVGRMFDLTRERVRQIEGRALAKLRHPSSAFELESLL
jgi:RNA polymerase primary sigma factor